eukprot:jgi/Mesvir1/28206/Mv04759-RA.1
MVSGQEFTEEVVELHRYNPEITPQLEVYIQNLVSSQGYSLETWLSLLRMYQFFPERFNLHLVPPMLVKALMQLPNPDFNLCMALIPDRIQSSEPYTTLANMALCLQSGRFAEFWNLAAQCRQLWEPVPGFENAIRMYGIKLLSVTYRRVPTRVLAEVVNMEGAALDALVAQQRSLGVWSVVQDKGGVTVTFPITDANNPGGRQRKAATVSRDQMARLLTSAQKV